jgi:hypothetical protein
MVGDTHIGQGNALLDYGGLTHIREGEIVLREAGRDSD